MIMCANAARIQHSTREKKLTGSIYIKFYYIQSGIEPVASPVEDLPTSHLVDRI